MYVSCSVLSCSELWALPPCAAHVQAQHDLALAELFLSHFPVQRDLCCQITLDHVPQYNRLCSPLLLKPYQRTATSSGPGVYTALGTPCKQLSGFSRQHSVPVWDSGLFTEYGRTSLNRPQTDRFCKCTQVRS